MSNLPTTAVQPQQNMAVNLFDIDQFETMQRICKMYVNSDLVPESYRVSDKRNETKAIANCMIAVCMAQRMNADHLMVMQNLDIIQGRPSWSAKFLIATVNSCGRFAPLRYKWTDLGEITNAQYTDYVWNQQTRQKDAVTKTIPGPIKNLQCIAYTTEKGSTDILESTPITMEMAIKEGWYSKAGSKWQTMPQLMLQYRAASFWQRAYAPEISMGMITQEEAADIVDVEYIDVTDDNKASEHLKKELSGANKETFTPPASPDNTPKGNTDPVVPDKRVPENNAQPQGLIPDDKPSWMS